MGVPSGQTAARSRSVPSRRGSDPHSGSEPTLLAHPFGELEDCAVSSPPAPPSVCDAAAGPPPRGLSAWLARAPLPVLTAYAAAVAFCTYFCMYAFRKPFDAVKFTGSKFLGSEIELKTACVVSQVIGYTLSKYLGTKVCSEVRSSQRAYLLIGLIVWAELALLLFGALPPSLKPVCMFLNGLPLGMVWGVCLRYLEGRRASEVMVAGLSCSYIIAGAATRDVGRDLVMATWGVPEAWMPAVTGLVFLLPFLIAVLLLNQLPAPSAADIAARSERVTMDARQRRAFLAHFGIGYGMLLTAYFFLTALRDFRDHYGAELFDALGLGARKAIFTRTELWAMLGVILALAALNLIRSHRRALYAVYSVIVAGFALIGLASVAFRAGTLDGYWWMVLVGLGLYLAYVPFGAVLFERMMAASRFTGTAVFAIMLADGIGYTGSVLFQLFRDLMFGGLNRLDFFVPYATGVSISGVLLMTASAILVMRRTTRPR